MRILVVADGLEPLLGHTVAGLADRGHDVRVIDITDQTISALPLLAEPADVVYFEAAYVAAELASSLDRLPATLMMCTGSDVRVLPDTQRWLRLALPTVFASATRVVCRSADLRDWAIRRGAPPERTTVLYPGVDLEMFDARKRLPPRDDDVLRLVSVGRQHWVKGYEYAVQAVALAVERGYQVEYQIVGPDRGAGASVALAIRDLGLSEWVAQTSARSQRGVQAALARSDVFVLPSVSEGVSRAAQEAMAMGLPVITTDAGGMPEVVTDGVEGFVVPIRDPAALSHAITAMADDDERRMRMGERAAARVREFDVRHHLDEIESTLEELATFSEKR